MSGQLSRPTDDHGNITAVRFLASFVVTFGVAMAIFAVARAVGFIDQSWRMGLIASAAVAAALTVLNVFANKGTHRLPTSR
jgi:hypothetical protein